MTKFQPFSKKQMRVLTWWCDEALRKHDGIICDGAVRSGKTLCMSLSFVSWALAAFPGGSFALCGKTITSLRRNVVTPLMELLSGLGFVCTDRVSRNLLDISHGGRSARFYLFGGKDEGSASLIQGMTLSGVLFDEVALMPRSFVEQALARCSVEGSKLWFNCNPEHPYHWFYREWIMKAKEKNALLLHFTMRDNPALSHAIRKRYESLYSGVFYERFIQGRWVAAQGLVYPMFKEARHVFSGEEPPCERYVLSCDYGTVNPCSVGLWGLHENVWHRLREYYYDARKEGISRTDEEHYAAVAALAACYPVETIVVDPSAASFIACIRQHGFYRVLPAKNDVLSGIRRVGDALAADKLRFSERCADTLREFSLYVWEQKAGTDAPRKENDHAMDDIRYLVSTILHGEADDFFVVAASRGEG